ncbi:MAG: flagellar export chaperone FliS [Aquabacterium sp.]|uniref:flagellar export chaperone FliS n=1 Tax=Aquabacterium sp. TaxID=1872578 RepID=UPI0025C3FBBC|nr:flagellar export chaperone FliS [Aquabacterium sp.]MBI3381726.1 flagellar export chaperone FliS [Aquabacterium sp.]
MDQDAYRSYHAINLSAQTAQASPVQLVIVLMDGLLEELARARAHIEAKRYELKANSLDKCINILNGLSSALNADTPNEVVNNLGQLYDYCAQQLYQAGVRLDAALVDEVSKLITTLRGGWQSVQAQGN